MTERSFVTAGNAPWVVRIQALAFHDGAGARSSRCKHRALGSGALAAPRQPRHVRQSAASGRTGPTLSRRDYGPEISGCS
jgi:hypothetical protein